MKNRTVTITVKSQFEEVFGFLADPESMPLWATGFCKSIRTEDDRWIITTPDGELFFAVDTNRASGCIDMYAGPTLETMELFPIRLIRLDSGETGVVFSFFKCQRASSSDALYNAQYLKLVEEATVLAERFGGGDVSWERSAPTMYSGFVTEKMEETRDFYVEHFGFAATFDASYYVHLIHPASEQQIGLMAKDVEGGASHREFESSANGVGYWISIETDAVEEDFERLSEAGVPVVEGLKDQPWGERTGVLKDPNGVLVYLAQQNGKMEESLKQYLVESTVAAHL